ncbi:MAG TPA: hypothetical protein VN873_14465 [Candidatus Angelobacter sp.]|nr:hypothetical protein [Candidatus Angelobacter sp.]
MTTLKTTPSWIPSLVAALALAGAATFCQAQSVITLSNDSAESSAFYDGGPAGATYTWIPTNGPNGGGCIQGVIDGVTTTEFDPAFNVSFVSGSYYQVTFQMKIDSASGTGSAGYGHLQMALRDSSFSWVGVGYAEVDPGSANDWTTYTYAIPGPSFNVAHLQFQLQGSGAYSGPVTIFIGDVTVTPLANPTILSAFTNDVVSSAWNSQNMAATLDPNIDAPYTNPVNNSGPTSILPAGSVEFAAAEAVSGYPGGQLSLPFNASDFQSIAFDVYYDGPTPSDSTDYGGFQMFIADGPPNYEWKFIGSANFTAGMIGKWTHFNFPCASSGVINANGIAIQATPGTTGGSVPITFHMDNLVLWSPQTAPSITALTRGTPGGVQFTLDANDANNLFDQEGITSPSTNNVSTDYFWLGQTPATYSFTLTNFPSPASAPQFDAHIYLINGNTIPDNSPPNLFNYNQTYSGPSYNAADYLGLHVQNGTNGGVVAVVDWKTNAPNANATNLITFNFPTMANANGTWSLNFTDDTHGNVVAADGSVNNFTLPDFLSDPNYTGNFGPSESFVNFGVFKNGNITNNNQTFTMTAETVTNSVTSLIDNFSGPGLTANNNWQIAEYYQFAADRAVWQPFGTAFFIHWNTTASGWSVQSSSNLLGNWGSAGVTYTFPDGTGTNTVGAISATNLPSGGAGFFRLVK